MKCGLRFLFAVIVVVFDPNCPITLNNYYTFVVLFLQYINNASMVEYVKDISHSEESMYNITRLQFP